MLNIGIARVFDPFGNIIGLTGELGLVVHLFLVSVIPEAVPNVDELAVAYKNNIFDIVNCWKTFFALNSTERDRYERNHQLSICCHCKSNYIWNFYTVPSSHNIRYIIF